MNILFISYWSIKEGLTQSTVIPNVKILSEFKKINKIILVTIERDGLPEQASIHPKVIHYPIRSESFALPLVSKVIDFYRIPRILTRLIGTYKIQKIIARGSPAGALAYLTWKRNGVPFYVESFEPHADYMLESEVWKKWDLKYLYEKKWELKVKRYASGLITVSHNYKTKLQQEGILNIPIEVAPCAVDAEEFKFNQQTRSFIRKKYNIPNHVVTGIYVGKFGDIYYDLEAFNLFKATYEFFKKEFFLILITPDNHRNVKRKLLGAGFPLNNFIINTVETHKIPEYLSAADFGFAPIRKSPSRLFCSAVKIGEYWANGLPILLTEGVGDESFYIEDLRGGILFNINDPILALGKIRILVNDPAHRDHIPELAKRFRSFNAIQNSYEKILFKENY